VLGSDPGPTMRPAYRGLRSKGSAGWADVSFFRFPGSHS
jgi:hypothetical protein